MAKLVKVVAQSPEGPIPVSVPEQIASFDPLVMKTIDQLFPGKQFTEFRTSIKEEGIAKIGKTAISATLGPNGEVFAIAAAVERDPIRSERYLWQNVPDLSRSNQLPRPIQIDLYRRIARKEGTVNNSIKKKVALISQDGSFRIRHAKYGKRPTDKVVNELSTIFKFWTNNVNRANKKNAVSGSKGIRQLVRRGSRQALIEGDAFFITNWSKLIIPGIDRKISLPMFLQPMPSEEIVIATDILGIGAEVVYWWPGGAKIQALLTPRDPNVQATISELISPAKLNELKVHRKILLDPSLLVHIKNSGMDTDVYGESDVESAMTDIAYSRALKALDFVTIESLVNRMLLIQIGDPNKDSDYHNLAVAQQRVSLFSKLISNVGPNMMVVWAGHDIDTKDIGAHDSLLDTGTRHETSSKGIKGSLGVPDPVLTGGADGGNAVAWAGFISLGAVVSELQEEWTQSLTQLGTRIAEENGYSDVDVVWEFAHKLLADSEANAQVMINAFDRGLLSNKTLLEELGKDYESERNQRIMETETGDKEIFAAPIVPKGGPSGNQGTAPADQPGREPNNVTNKVGPERKRERKKVSKTT